MRCNCAGCTAACADSAGSATSVASRLAPTRLANESPASVSTGTSPAGIAISPNGVYAYVTNQGDDTVGQYQIASGRLTAMATATVATGDAPHSVAVSPDGRYAYVTNSADATVSQYAIGSGGSLQALSTATIGSGGMKPTAIVVR